VFDDLPGLLGQHELIALSRRPVAALNDVRKQRVGALRHRYWTLVGLAVRLKMLSA
jgi:hypothetical protein